MDWIKETKGILKDNQHLPGNLVQLLILHLQLAIWKENLVTLESPRVLLGRKGNFWRHFQVSKYTSPDNQRATAYRDSQWDPSRTLHCFHLPQSGSWGNPKVTPETADWDKWGLPYFRTWGHPIFPSQGHCVLIGSSSSQGTRWQELTGLFLPSPSTPQDVHPWGHTVPLYLSKCSRV